MMFLGCHQTILSHRFLPATGNFLGFSHRFHHSEPFFEVQQTR
jgi:hypothetical protein